MITGMYDGESIENNPKLAEENKCMGGIPTTVEPRRIVNELPTQDVRTGVEGAVRNRVCHHCLRYPHIPHTSSRRIAPPVL